MKTDKRGLIVVLVIATVILFIGAVWAIVTYLPLNLAAATIPTSTVDVQRVSVNCASPVAFWREHPELYPARVVIGGQVYKMGELTQIMSGQAEDLPSKLQAQLIVAYLNILSGADQSYIETTIFEAYSWLVQHQAGSQPSDGERDEGTRLFNLLEAYNLGLTGVKPCEIAGLLSTKAETVSASASVTVTQTASQTPSITPSETPTLANFPTERIYTVVVPSRTPRPTTEVPEAQPTHTYTAEPSKTNAPTNTTEAPTPANTATIVPTIPPTATPAPTYAPSQTITPP